MTGQLRPIKVVRRTRWQLTTDRILALAVGAVLVVSTVALWDVATTSGESTEPTFRWACQEDELLVPFTYPPRTQRDLRCVNREDIHP